jgi:hypothetical protein
MPITTFGKLGKLASINKMYAPLVALPCVVILKLSAVPNQANQRALLVNTGDGMGTGHNKWESQMKADPA